MSILYIIPARGNSKGLPGKNIRPLAGKPLIAHSIEVARQCLQPDHDIICVSTDSEEIAGVAAGLGEPPPFLRPAELATDTAGTYEVLLHAIRYYREKGREFEYVLLLQPTSPFRKASHLREVIDIMKRQPDTEMVVSVRRSKDNPYFNLFEENTEGFLRKSKDGNFSRRQDCPDVYAYNGSIYLMKVSALLEYPIASFRKVVKYVMSDDYSIDIDTIRDWEMAEFIYKQNPQIL